MQPNHKDFEGHTVSKDEFHSAVRELERLTNAGCTSVYCPSANANYWYIAGKCVGWSNGNLGQATVYYVNRSK